MDTTVKAIENFASVMNQRREMLKKEKQVISKLNRALKGTGYQLVKLHEKESDKRTARTVTAGSGSTRAHKVRRMPVVEHNGVGKRGPGRPRLKQIL